MYNLDKKRGDFLWTSILEAPNNEKVLANKNCSENIGGPSANGRLPNYDANDCRERVRHGSDNFYRSGLAFLPGQTYIWKKEDPIKPCAETEEWADAHPVAYDPMRCPGHIKIGQDGVHYMSTPIFRYGDRYAWKPVNTFLEENKYPCLAVGSRSMDEETAKFQVSLNESLYPTGKPRTIEKFNKNSESLDKASRQAFLRERLPGIRRNEVQEYIFSSGLYTPGEEGIPSEKDLMYRRSMVEPKALRKMEDVVVDPDTGAVGVVSLLQTILPLSGCTWLSYSRKLFTDHDIIDESTGDVICALPLPNAIYLVNNMEFPGHAEWRSKYGTQFEEDLIKHVEQRYTFPRPDSLVCEEDISTYTMLDERRVRREHVSGYDDPNQPIVTESMKNACFSGWPDKRI
ncbi:unknown [Feldmannia species virus]|uniref:Uncharacterized protein n=1 Tax=Feldmannia species virus TaxID=39420 RepID=B5LWI1_9PHYC|nr:hypothetical protein FeldSpV_gp092 [Feldmannia species virus]ACH46844.1 unknown [Feldmannia species virus]